MVNPAPALCSCPARSGFGQERWHDSANTRCALYRKPAALIDDAGQARLLLQSAGIADGGTVSAGVRRLIDERDRARDIAVALEQEIDLIHRGEP
jgi:hypothetical protein